MSDWAGFWIGLGIAIGFGCGLSTLGDELRYGLNAIAASISDLAESMRSPAEESDED